jgi:hypothetical protein
VICLGVLQKRLIHKMSRQGKVAAAASGPPIHLAALAPSQSNRFCK